MTKTAQHTRSRFGSPVPATGSRRTWMSVAGLATMFALGFAIAFLVASWTSGPDATQRRIEELKQAEAQRDVEQVGALIELAKGTRDRLTPVLEDLAKVAPLDQA